MDSAGDVVISKIALFTVSMRIQTLTDQVVSTGYTCDVNPLAVQVASVAIAAVCRNPLRLSKNTAIDSVAISPCTRRVFQTERGLVALCYFDPRVGVAQVVVHKGFEGVEVSVAVVVDPVGSIQIGEEVAHTPVVRHALEPKKSPVVCVCVC